MTFSWEDFFQASLRGPLQDSFQGFFQDCLEGSIFLRGYTICLRHFSYDVRHRVTLETECYNSKITMSSLK